MKLRLIIEILVLCALVAFGTARVIDSRDHQEFSPRLISNVTKNRQNEITVTNVDYDDAVGSQEIVVGEDDLITNNVSGEPAAAAASSSSAQVSQEVSNDVALPSDDNTEAPVNIDDAHPLNRYCTCNEAECNCCREFKLPLVSVRGPGCASLRYLGKNRMTIAIKYGDITLTSRTISGRKARPVCLNLPGGFSQFCGRVYGISRESDDFQACLGLELRAEEEVEAALRVSCFKFGPKGLKMTDPQPLPPVTAAIDDDDDDEEGGGLLGLVTGAGDSDEDEYDDDEEATGQDAATGDEDADLLGFADDEDEDDEDDDEDADELDDDDDDDDDADDVPAAGAFPSGFSLLDGIFGDSPNKNKKKPVQTRNKVNTIAEEVKENQVGAKVKIPNSPAILSSASLSQNEIDNNLTKDSIAVATNSVDLAPAVEAAVEAAAAAKPVAEEKPKPVAESSIVSELQSNAGVPLISTTAKPKKKRPASFLETIESFIGGDDDDDDEEEKDEAADEDDEEEDEEENDDEEEEETDADAEKDDEEEEEVEKDDEEEEEVEKDEEEEDEEEDEENDDEEEEATATDEKEEVVSPTSAEKKDKKKKNNYGLGFFARLMKFI